MTSLANLKTRLSIELGDSETINKNDAQRIQAINDACRQIYLYREWPELFENTTIQSVDGIVNIPLNMKIPVALWFGKGTRLDYDFYSFVNQTDFEASNDKTATLTEENDLQVMKIYTAVNRGHDAGNTTVNSTIGINDVSAREQVGQSLVVTTDTIEGALLKLSTVGSPEGTLTISLYDDSADNDLPTGVALASGTLNISEISSSEEWFWTKFTTAASNLTENTRYVLTVSADYATDASNYVAWSYHTTSQITGAQVLYDGASWSTGTGDQGVVLCSNYFNFKYVKKFVDLSASIDDSGLSSEFDQAIGKFAAGIILTTKGEIQMAQYKMFGASGNQNRPEQNSAFGLLDLLWTNKRMYGLRQGQRLMTIYEKSRSVGSTYDTWPYSNFTNLL